MADKPNPFLKLLSQVKADAKKPTLGSVTPKAEEKNTSDSVNEGLTNPLVPATPVSTAAQEKTSLPTPSQGAERLFNASNDLLAPPTDNEFESSTEIVPSGAQELGAMNTDSLEPNQATRPEKTIVSQARAFQQKLILDSSQSVRALCDRIDAMMKAQADAALTGPALVESRNAVQSLMVTLKTRPEFDEVLIADDIRNVMKFIRATRQEALDLREVKTVKKTVRAAKSETTKKKLGGFDQAFSAVMFGGFKLPGDK